jgi:hypothetical protein
MLYPMVVTVHLMCAILFIGVVFFEVILLEGIRKRLGDELMMTVEVSLIARARKVMPWVVATLFASGIWLGYVNFSSSGLSWDNSFSVLLTAKIVLALSVLVHFVTAIRASLTGCMSSRRFQITHISVAIHMFFIVILAKAMFYVSW